jgi:hypothetical protein
MKTCPTVAAIFAILLWVQPVSATVRVVNKTAGPYTSIGAAVAASGTNDTVEIADSAVYYETFTIGAAQTGLLITVAPGEQPWISGEALPATASVITVAAPATISGLGVYVGGAQYGVQTSAGGVLLDDMSFDIHVLPRGSNWTFGVFAGSAIKIQDSSFLGPDTAAQTSGGILSNTAAPAHMEVINNDFWGIGTAGGAVGVGQPAGSSITISGNAFGQTSSTTPIIAINSWGSTSITENRNAFRNINARIVGFAGHTQDPTDKSTFGAVAPAAVQNATMTTASASDTLTTALGCATASSFTYPDAATLNHLLDRVVISNYFGENGYFPGGPYPQLDIDLLAAMDEIAPRVWEEFQISWGRQFDPATWQQIAASASRVHAEPQLAQTLLMGNLMEDVSSVAVLNTPIAHDFWLWVAYQFPDAASRPIQTKIIANSIRLPSTSRRVQAHWFEPTAMAGIAATFTPPNLQTQEGVLYYLYLAREMIDAGLNVIQFNQPQLTFGQGSLAVNATATRSFKTLARFVKEYGVCKARPSNGQRFALVSLSEAYKGLQNDTASKATEDVDYTEASAGTDANGGGLGWPNGLGTCPHNGGAFLTVPPAGTAIAGKPVTVDFDNNGQVTDEISVYAHATPLTRNTWLPCFDQFITDTGNQLGARYHLALNGVRDVTGGQQSFAGYATPPGGLYPTSFLLPFDPYGDIASTEASIFFPR